MTLSNFAKDLVVWLQSRQHDHQVAFLRGRGSESLNKSPHGTVLVWLPHLGLLSMKGRDNQFKYFCLGRFIHTVTNAYFSRLWQPYFVVSNCQEEVDRADGFRGSWNVVLVP